jgi:hypothetical protein
MTRLQERIATDTYAVWMPFTALNIPDAAGNAVVAGVGASAGAEYVATHDGFIIGISVALNADLTTGEVTFRPTINGTADTSLSAIVNGTVQRDYGRCLAGAVPFSAGQRIGVDWVETGTVDPVTADAVIGLLVVFEGIEF